jgi:hypothetical protein
MLRRNSGVEKGPPWPAMASEVTGGRRRGGGYSGGAFCTDRRRRQWSSQRLQCQSRGKEKRGRVSLVMRVRGRGGSGVGDATWRKEEGRRTGPDIRQPRGSIGDGRWSGDASTVREPGSRAARVGHTCRRGPVGEGGELGRA